METQPNTPPAPPPPASFSLSESAAARINHLKQIENNPALYFRITVKGGGCSGFSYDFALDANPPSPLDTLVERDGARVAIDDMSMGIIGGSMLDYTEDMASAGFEVKNPNATAKCGCGNSFSVAL